MSALSVSEFKQLDLLVFGRRGGGWFRAASAPM